MKRNTGFTIMELMVVVSILGLLSAIAIPNVFAWKSNRQIVNAANELNAVFQLARTEAIKENADVVITIDLVNNRCEVFVDDGKGGGIAQNQIRDGLENRVKLLFLPAGIDMYNQTFAQPWYAYNSRGIPINDANVINGGEIHMKNTAGTRMGVELSLAGSPMVISSDDGVTWN